MGVLLYRLAVETPDGVRTTFNTPTPYTPGTVVLVLNSRSRAEGWVENGGTLVTLDEAPPEDDIVAFYYNQL